MNDKTQTSLWLRNDLHYLVKSNDINLSKWVNDMLEKYFSVSSIEEVEKQLSAKKQEVLLFEQKRMDMIESGAIEKDEQVLADQSFGELKKLYLERRKVGDNQDAEIMWITGPHNLQRCKLMNVDPVGALKLLRKWYDGQKEDNNN